MRAPSARHDAAPPVREGEIELAIARLLLAGAATGMVLLGIGVALMAVNGIDPLSATFPGFEPARIPGDLVALRAEGFLWSGILIVIATPIARVLGELVTFTMRGDRVMAGVALGILGIVALSVLTALAVEG